MTPAQAAALGIVHAPSLSPAVVAMVEERDRRAMMAQEAREAQRGPKPAPGAKRNAAGHTEGQAPNPRSSVRGRNARAAGESIEALVSAACEEYKREGVAWVDKAPTPWRIVKSLGGGRFECVPERKAGVDYRGTLSGGRSVVFELKHSGTASLPLVRHGKPTLTSEQAAELEWKHEAGAVAAVLVAVRTKPRGRHHVRRWFWLPWPGWVAAAEEVRGRSASIGVAVMLKHGREVSVRPSGAPDWMEVVE